MDHVLQVRELVKHYRTKHGVTKAVDSASFDVGKGEIIGLLGPNGAGKTTIIKSILMLTHFDEGMISIEGDDIQKGGRKILGKVGAVLDSQRNIYWRLTPLQNLRYYAGTRGLTGKSLSIRTKSLLETLELWDVRDKPVRLLSRGTQQKVAIACAVIHAPSLILLDEPTLGLDVSYVQVVKQWLRTMVDETGSSLLVTSHDLDFIEDVCDRVIIIFDGKVALDVGIKELKKRFQPKKVIEIELEHTIDSGTSLELEKSGSVVQSDAISGLVRVESSDFSELFAVFATLKNSSAKIKNVKVSEASLEQIFISLTNARHSKSE